MFKWVDFSDSDLNEIVWFTAFQEEFIHSNDHLHLATLGSFFPVLTFDLLAITAQNFTEISDISIIVSELLSSPISKSLGGGLHEFHVNVRSGLLKNLKKKEGLESKLARFLEYYLKERTFKIPSTGAFIALEFTASSIIRPKETAQELIRLYQNNRTRELEFKKRIFEASHIDDNGEKKKPLSPITLSFTMIDGLSLYRSGEVEKAIDVFSEIKDYIHGSELSVDAIKAEIPEAILKEVKLSKKNKEDKKSNKDRDDSNDTLFLFCIGGTGSRVLRALTFLLAAGVRINAKRIVPILIDPDRENGDLNRTMEILRNYQEIRKKLEFTHNKFFRTDIQSLASLDATDNDTHLRITDDFRFNIDGTKEGNFADFLEVNQMDRANQTLMRALFSQDNLDADLEVGLKSNPHMSSVVLNQFKESDEFKFFVSKVNYGDRIFVVSSIFGATGAAGFPLLVKNIRDAKPPIPNNKRLKNLPIGAVTVLPYFGVEPDPNIIVDKNTFISKAKAALAYYEQHLSGNKSLNALYYLGDRVTMDVTPHEGGKGQTNNAHYVELLSALSIIDYADIDSSDLKCEEGRAESPIFKEYGLLGTKNLIQINFNNLGKKSRSIISQPLIQYAYSVNYWINNLERALSNRIKQAFKGYGVSANFLYSSFFREDLSVFNERFLEWLREMQHNHRSFYALEPNVEDQYLHTMVQGITQAKVGSFFNKKVEWGYAEYDYELNKAYQKTPDLPPEQKLMALFYKATEAIYDQRIKEQLMA